MREVVLISMPFGAVLSPSIGLSLLKSGLTRAGISSRIQYFSIRFAELVGWSFYDGVAHDGDTGLTTLDLAGEWIFNGSLFETTKAQEEEYVREILINRNAWPYPPCRIPRELVRRILRARAHVPRFLDWCVGRVLRDNPRIVGFTSSFQQHVPSLALARRIKNQRPEIAIVFGGANCEGPMGAETVRAFPFVDAAVSGEGDIVFPELAQRLIDGMPIDDLAGVRTGEEVRRNPNHWSRARSVERLDSLPYPDFSDFFRQFRSSRFARRWLPRTMFESSRGCWWAQRVHCTFCGLNGPTTIFRAKSPVRALDEIAQLAKEHPRAPIQAVDNILDPAYFDVLIPELRKLHVKTYIFYETKSNLTKDQVRSLREAGITQIQPGIESLSDPVLRLMRKGVTALQNIQLLKWCRELGVAAYWNVMCGIPGEPVDEYARMANLVPLLVHLPPPRAAGILRLDRFSPFFERPSAFGLTEIRPIESYCHVYPLSVKSVRNLAYSFSYSYEDGRDPDAYTRALYRRIASWQSRGETAALFSVDVGDALLVFDLRPRARRFLTVLQGLDRDLYLAGDCVIDMTALGRSLPGCTDIRERVDRLVARGLMLRDGDRLLALAIPAGDYQPGREARAKFRNGIRHIGKQVSGGTSVSFATPLSVRPIRRRALRTAVAKRIDSSLFVVQDEHTMFVRNCG